MDPLKPVRPGDPLKIQSATWNRILDAARTHQQSRGRTGANPLLADALAAANLVLVQWPGADLAAFSVVTPNGMAIEPDSESLALAAQRRPVFVGQAPTATTDTPIIVVDPIATDGIGRAAIGGVVPCRINVLETDHEYAEPSPAITDYLVSASTGPARILWREGGTGEQWAVVLLQGAGGSRQGFFARLTTSSGGAWNFYKLTLSSGVYVDDGSEVTGYNAVPLAIDGTNVCTPSSGLRVWMIPSKQAGKYEFLPCCEESWCGDYWTFENIPNGDQVTVPNENSGDYVGHKIIVETLTKIPAGSKPVLVTAGVYGWAGPRYGGLMPTYPSNGVPPAWVHLKACLAEVTSDGTTINDFLTVPGVVAQDQPGYVITGMTATGSGGSPNPIWTYTGGDMAHGSPSYRSEGHLTVSLVLTPSVTDRYIAWTAKTEGRSGIWGGLGAIKGFGGGQTYIAFTEVCDTCEPITPPEDLGQESGSGGSGGGCCTSLAGQSGELVIADGTYAGTYTATWGGSFVGDPWIVFETTGGNVYITCNGGNWQVTTDEGQFTASAECGPPAVVTIPAAAVASTTDATVTT